MAISSPTFKMENMEINLGITTTLKNRRRLTWTIVRRQREGILKLI